MINYANGKTPSGVVRSLRPSRSAGAKPAVRNRSWKPIVFGGLALVLIGGAFAAGELPRRRQERALESSAASVASAAPAVSIVTAREAPPDSERVLPGSALPLLEASLYPRITGYLKTRHVDIGDRVEVGQVLAEIAAPDTDDQLAQARANLNQARANLTLAKANAALAKITLQRDMQAGAGTAIPFIQIDQEKAAVKTTDAQVAAAEASIAVNEAAVQRFTDLTSFEKIVAPFKGVVTARNVDAGDLLMADNPTGKLEMFHIMRTDMLRVFVNVPQVYATGIRVGQQAVVFRREEPTTTFAGKVTRTANALDPNTRTLLTEVQVPNPVEALRPGMFLQVRFVLDREFRPVLIPAAALATRSEGPRVAVVDSDNRLHYHAVQLGRDFGADVEVLRGLNPGDRVIVRPGDDLPENQTVEPVAGPTK